MSQMRKPRLVLSDTMNYWIARKPDKVLEVLRKVDVALLNEEEARALLLVSDLTVVVRAVGVDLAIATFDAAGRPAPGARIVVTLVHEMARTKTRYGLATLCISGGMGLAAAFELV